MMAYQTSPALHVILQSAIVYEFESLSQSLYETALLLRKQCDFRSRVHVWCKVWCFLAVAKVCMRLP